MKNYGFISSLISFCREHDAPGREIITVVVRHGNFTGFKKVRVNLKNLKKKRAYFMKDCISALTSLGSTIELVFAFGKGERDLAFTIDSKVPTLSFVTTTVGGVSISSYLQ